jgi:hypothetical protein
MDDDRLATLWKFVRGDLAIAKFEAWLYDQNGLEALLGGDLYHEVISANYGSPYQADDVREKLRAALRPPLTCECMTLSDTAVVPMGGDGLDNRFFATIEQVRPYGRDLWWLRLSRCRVCGQNWMIAQEERIYDDHFLKRLNVDEARSIVDNDSWPDDFLTYEKVLKLGRQVSKACHFFDPMAHSLIDTVRDLIRKRPNITVTEIADLLGIEVEHAKTLVASV